jgi:hypothetical protein
MTDEQKLERRMFVILSNKIDELHVAVDELRELIKGAKSPFRPPAKAVAKDIEAAL